MAMTLGAPAAEVRDRVIDTLPRRRETVDARLFVAVNGLPHTGYWDGQLELLSDLGKGAGWVAASIWLALSGGPRGRRAGIATSVAMFTAVGLVQGPLKTVFRRNRPFKNRLAWVVGPEPVDSSFPSGHTAGSFAAATALAAFYPRERPVLFGLAAGVGFSRVYLGHHFVSDVLVGAALGAAIGSAVGRAARAGLGDAGDDGTAAEAPAADRHRTRPVRAPRRAVMHRRRPLVEADR